MHLRRAKANVWGTRQCDTFPALNCTYLVPTVDRTTLNSRRGAESRAPVYAGTAAEPEFMACMHA